MKHQRVGFTGTQHGMTEFQKRKFEELIKDLEPSEFRHGDCLGADLQAHLTFQVMFPTTEIIIHPPKSKSKRAFCTSDTILPPEPYHIRNHAIVDAVDTLIATPLTMKEELRSGTWSTVRYARLKRRTIHIIYPLQREL